MVEKPLSDSKEELYELIKAQDETGKIVAVCYELRYGPAYEKLAELLKDGTIGKLIAIDASERVAWWHQAQAYVRLQSEVNELAHPTILAKCSHDLDLIQYYAGAECDTVSSVGDLSFFKKENAPVGSAERCLDCKYIEECPYSAKKIYVDQFIKAGCPEWVWPYNKVSLKKPLTVDDIYEGLKTKCQGKCAFKCGVESNEHVVDNQLVQLQFKNGVKASLKMVFAGQAGRRYNLFGTSGEVLMDKREETIEILIYGKEKEVIKFNTLLENGNSHGGGDERIIENIYSVLRNEGENRTSLKESVESHLIGICAEESRLNGGKIIKVHES